MFLGYNLPERGIVSLLTVVPEPLVEGPLQVRQAETDYNREQGGDVL